MQIGDIWFVVATPAGVYRWTTTTKAANVKDEGENTKNIKKLTYNDCNP